ncbi:MAG: ImmA/IrrE family metallo-endopeptidase [Synergistaceae bacterium]|nr:ImmA/IrrE family metallo-endopeptidase [Synergistaceae bacterium]
MGYVGYRVPPLSRKKIEDQANSIRLLFGLENTLYFDIVRFLELSLPKIISDFLLIPVGNDDLGSDFARAYPDKNLIYVRDEVYVNAYNKKGRDRLILAHEFSHWLLHKGISLAYTKNYSGTLKKYEDSEWQADVLGAQLLAPTYLIKDLSVNQIMKECGVSESAAKTQLNVANKK